MSYNLSSWKHAGFASHFEDVENFPLVIDQRDPVREQALCDTLPLAGKPALLVNVKGGISSPYKDADRFMEMVRANWSHLYHVIDLSTVRAHRIYDLLGLFDRACLLITSDTATLHLAAASSIPVIALVNDIDWLGTQPRCHCIYRVRYCEAIGNMQIVNMLVASLPTGERSPLPQPKEYVKPVRRVVHAVERHIETNPASQKRKEKAWASWEVLYKQGVIPAHYENYKRDARAIGDHRALPFLKDVLQCGLDKLSPEDDASILLWTNDDDIPHPRLPEALQMFCALFECGTSQRREFAQPYPTQEMSPESLTAISLHHMGRDAIFGTAGWFKRSWAEIPDFILGAPVFDLCIAALIRKQKGFTTTRTSVEHIIPSCELMAGYISHEQHQSVWPTLPVNNPANSHNARLFESWAKRYAPEIRTPL